METATAMETNDYLFNVEDAKVREDLPGLTVGSYPLVKITSFRAGTNRKQQKFFAFTLQILQSEGEGALPKGTRATFARKQDDYDYYVKDLKSILAALVNEPPSAITNKMCQTIVDDPTSIEGTYASVVVSEQTSKKSGKSFKDFSFRAAAPANAPIL